MLQIIINSQSKIPIYKQIYVQIRNLILNGILSAGCLLPSERQLANTLGIHRNTIVKVYDELSADGYIQALRGSGHIVANPQFESHDMVDKTLYNGIEWKYRLPQIRRRHKLFRDFYIGAKNQKDKNEYFPFSSDLAGHKLQSIMDLHVIMSQFSLNEMRSPSTHNGKTEGLYNALLTFLRLKGIQANRSEIIIANNSFSALTDIVELIMHPGDSVIMEEPCHPFANIVFSRKNLKIITVPVDDDGMITEIIEPLIVQHSPKLLYVNSSYNDPSTRSMNKHRREILLNLSYKYDIPIYEDDWASDLTYSDNNMYSIKSFDKTSNVIYSYSFHLAASPSINLSVIVAHPLLVKKLSQYMEFNMHFIDELSTIILQYILNSNQYMQTIAHKCAHYKNKRDLMYGLFADRLPDIKIRKTDGGIHLWCELPQDWNLYRIKKDTQRHKIYIAWGEMFYSYTPQTHYMRLNFSYPTEQQIINGIEKLSAIIGRI